LETFIYLKSIFFNYYLPQTLIVSVHKVDKLIIIHNRWFKRIGMARTQNVLLVSIETNKNSFCAEEQRNRSTCIMKNIHFLKFNNVFTSCVERMVHMHRQKTAPVLKYHPLQVAWMLGEKKPLGLSLSIETWINLCSTVLY
jgi:hypothetical protein